jgi:hypothetical protein
MGVIRFWGLVNDRHMKYLFSAIVLPMCLCTHHSKCCFTFLLLPQFFYIYFLVEILGHCWFFDHWNEWTGMESSLWHLFGGIQFNDSEIQREEVSECLSKSELIGPFLVLNIAHFWLVRRLLFSLSHCQFENNSSIHYLSTIKLSTRQSIAYKEKSVGHTITQKI